MHPLRFAWKCHLPERVCVWVYVGGLHSPWWPAEHSGSRSWIPACSCRTEQSFPPRAAGRNTQSSLSHTRKPDVQRAKPPRRGTHSQHSTGEEERRLCKGSRWKRIPVAETQHKLNLCFWLWFFYPPWRPARWRGRPWPAWRTARTPSPALSLGRRTRVLIGGGPPLEEQTEPHKWAATINISSFHDTRHYGTFWRQVQGKSGGMLYLFVPSLQRIRRRRRECKWRRWLQKQSCRPLSKGGAERRRFQKTGVWMIHLETNMNCLPCAAGRWYAPSGWARARRSSPTSCPRVRGCRARWTFPRSAPARRCRSTCPEPPRSFLMDGRGRKG